MTNDPGRLAHNLTTVNTELTGWVRAVSGFKEDASFEMKQGNAEIGQAEHQGKITENQFADDEDLLKRASETLAATTDRCKEAEALARRTLSESQAAFKKANDTLDHWKKELEKARAWLERALQQLARARAELQQAQAKLSYAIGALQNAERSLNRCLHDDNRTNCRGEEAAVQRARGMVYAAQQEVRAAELEVKAAEEEVARARARVDACNRAVGFATEAGKLAKSTEHTAQQGVNYAERSLEYVEAARKALVEAKAALSTEGEAVTVMRAALKEGVALVTEAQMHLRNAEYYEDNVQRITLGTTHTLEEKIEQLRRLDRPDLFGGPDLSDRLKILIPNALAAGIITLNLLSPSNIPPSRHQTHAVQHQAESRQSLFEDLGTIADETKKAFDEQDDLYDKIRHPPEDPSKR